MSRGPGRGPRGKRFEQRAAVLYFLSVFGEMSTPEIERKLEGKIVHASLWNALKDLVAFGFIEEVPAKQRLSRAKRIVRTYRITLDGLLEIFRMELKEGFKAIDLRKDAKAIVKRVPGSPLAPRLWFQIYAHPGIVDFRWSDASIQNLFRQHPHLVGPFLDSTIESQTRAKQMIRDLEAIETQVMRLCPNMRSRAKRVPDPPHVMKTCPHGKPLCGGPSDQAISSIEKKPLA